MLCKKFGSAGEVSKEVGVGVPLVSSTQARLEGPLNAQLKKFLQYMLKIVQFTTNCLRV